MKPCRPAPPPPPGERLLDGQSSPQQSVFSFTPDVSPVSQLSTCQVDAPPRAPLLPEVNPVDLIQSPGKVPSYITVLPPSPLPEDVHANIQVSNTAVILVFCKFRSCLTKTLIDHHLRAPNSHFFARMVHDKIISSHFGHDN